MFRSGRDDERQVNQQEQKLRIAVPVPALPLQRRAHGQLVSAEPAPLVPSALPFKSARSEQEPRTTQRRRVGENEEEDVDTFYSVAQVRLAYKRRMRGMEAAQQRMHLRKVRHTTKRPHQEQAKQRPLNETDVATPETSSCITAEDGDAAEAAATVRTLDGLSFRKYSVDLEYRNAIVRSCRSALMQGQTVVLRAPLCENDDDTRECRMVLHSVHMQVSALTRGDVVPEAAAEPHDPRGPCTTMTLQPRR